MTHKETEAQRHPIYSGWLEDHPDDAEGHTLAQAYIEADERLRELQRLGEELTKSLGSHRASLVDLTGPSRDKAVSKIMRLQVELEALPLSAAERARRAASAHLEVLRHIAVTAAAAQKELEAELRQRNQALRESRRKIHQFESEPGLYANIAAEIPDLKQEMARNATEVFAPLTNQKDRAYRAAAGAEWQAKQMYGNRVDVLQGYGWPEAIEAYAQRVASQVSGIQHLNAPIVRSLPHAKQFGSRTN